MATRTDPVVLGKQQWFYVKKGSDYVALGCMTNYDENEPGYQPQRLSCRSGTKVSPGGEKDLATLNIEGVAHVYASGQVASNVSAEEIRGWTQSGTIVEAKWGGTLEGDPVHSGKGYFTGFSRRNPNDNNTTYSVTFNCTEEYATAALAPPSGN
ncbi:hypothetical protein DYU11_19960 [Fibrisoma montanum]|uniref:Phage tail protein n=1 Tax=Fibrisoma montanum TaxID=2305895 RepID=A0A418M3N9_9BACT|nr:hypothetical protein [Fibrisoma montanum]RIV20329.1 hypothetical protein DYU11_19960 [Fibrisoma montanum]